MTALFTCRRERGVTRSWLAKELGISVTTLWRYERGDVKTPQSTLFHAAALLQAPLQDLTDGTH
jgi:DNA-binding XRE family transcriptional regulator